MLSRKLFLLIIGICAVLVSACGWTAQKVVQAHKAGERDFHDADLAGANLEEASLWGGTAGDQYDPCYHLACDNFDNISLQALDFNSDAVAAATLQFAMNTEVINGQKGKGNFKARLDEMEYLGSHRQR